MKSDKDLKIGELAVAVAEMTAYKRHLDLDFTKPEGTPRKLMDSSRLNTLGWSPTTYLTDGLKPAYQDYHKNHA